MHAAETAQSLQRSSLYARKTQVKLHYFVSRELAIIGHRYFGMDRIAHLHWLRRQRQPAIRKARVAQPVSKWKERLPGEVSVSAPLHRVIFKLRQLTDVRVEGHR